MNREKIQENKNSPKTLTKAARTVKNENGRMSEDYQTTFNYLLTHIIIPRLMFSNLDFFYEKVLSNPQNAQIFMRQAVERAADAAKNNPQIEPAYEIPQFVVSAAGDSIESGLLVVRLPKYERDCDCSEIAFPFMRAHARYFTCELSHSPLIDKKFFILGEWRPEGENFSHHNYGEIDFENGASFPGMAAKLILDSAGKTSL